MEVGVVFQLAFREICFREIDLKSQFVKYECLENNRLYSTCIMYACTIDRNVK